MHQALSFGAAALLCLYLPGAAWRRGHWDSVPAGFARVLVSACLTTLTATALAAGQRFSLPALLACNAALTAAGFLLTKRSGTRGTGRKDRLGPAVALLAFALYWPAYPAFLGASDSSTYVATGISLAHHGGLSRQDDLGPRVPLSIRRTMFDSMSGLYGSDGPPFRRMPGAMMMDSLDSQTIWPNFFPVPSVWAAIFTSAAPPWYAAPEEFAPGFAPLFAALALWAFWLLARSTLPAGFALLAVGLLAVSGPFSNAARLPLSEPIAGFFALAGLAVLAQSRTGPGRAEKALAGLAFAAAIFVRVETALYLAMAMALLPFFRRGHRAAGFELSTSPAFLWPIAVGLVLTALESALVPGSYVAPLVDHVTNGALAFAFQFGPQAPLLAGGILAGGAVALALGTRLFGFSATMRWGLLGGIVLGHAAAANFLYERTPMWLSFYIGWSGLVLALAGALLWWRTADRPPVVALLLAFLTATALVLFYNPHVLPGLPWGARRFVPLLLPLLVLVATYACSRATSWHRIAGAIGIALLVYPVAIGARPYWRTALWEAGWEQFQEISAAIPPDGILLVDRELDPLMVGPALWLVKDRNSLPVMPLQYRVAREHFQQLVALFGNKEPVYFLTRGNLAPPLLPHVEMKSLAKPVSSLRIPTPKYSERPERVERYILPLTVYQVRPTENPRGVLIR